MPAPKPDFSLETSLGGIVAGIDEAGVGSWAGPVVAAAVILDAARIPPGVHDSKQLTPRQREPLYEALLACARVGVGSAGVAEIDALNILRASHLAMRRAVEALGVAPAIALVDGNRVPALPCPVRTIVGGDARCLSIAAASIVAKVWRDRRMRELAEEYPGYGWESNAGYGTPSHRRGLARLGVSPHHRRSYAPIRALLSPAQALAG